MDSLGVSKCYCLGDSFSHKYKFTDKYLYKNTDVYRDADCNGKPDPDTVTFYSDSNPDSHNDAQRTGN